MKGNHSDEDHMPCVCVSVCVHPTASPGLMGWADGLEREGLESRPSLPDSPQVHGQSPLPRSPLLKAHQVPSPGLRAQIPFLQPVGLTEPSPNPAGTGTACCLAWPAAPFLPRQRARLASAVRCPHLDSSDLARLHTLFLLARTS